MAFAVLHCTPPASPGAEDKDLVALAKCFRRRDFPFDGNTYPSQKQAPKNVMRDDVISLDLGKKWPTNRKLWRKKEIGNRRKLSETPYHLRVLGKHNCLACALEIFLDQKLFV